MASSASAYAMILWNLYNQSGMTKTEYNTTDIGLDEGAWQELAAKGVVIDKGTITGEIELVPESARQFLKLG